MANNRSPSHSWASVEQELREYKRQQQETWGDIDNSLLACYLADEIDPEGRAAVESAMERHPELRVVSDLVREVLDEAPPLEEAPPILAFTPQKKRFSPIARFRRVAALVMAACLLLALGWSLRPPSNEPKAHERDLARAVPPVDPEEGMAKRLALAEIFLEDGSAFLAQGEAEKAAAFFTQADKVAGAHRSIRDEVTEKMVQLVAVQHDAPFRKREVLAMKPMPEHLPVPAPPSAKIGRAGPSEAVRTMAAPPRSRPEEPNRAVAYHAYAYLKDGAQRSDKPELQNSCLWGLDRLKNKLSPEQRKEASRLLHKYRSAQRDRDVWARVYDHARLLSSAAQHGLQRELNQFSRQRHMEVVIETIPHLCEQESRTYRNVDAEDKEKYLRWWARRRSRALGVDEGVHVLVCMDPPTFQVTLSPKAKEHPDLKGLLELSQAMTVENLIRNNIVRGIENAGASTWDSLKSIATALSR